MATFISSLQKSLFLSLVHLFIIFLSFNSSLIRYYRFFCSFSAYSLYWQFTLDKRHFKLYNVVLIFLWVISLKLLHLRKYCLIIIIEGLFPFSFTFDLSHLSIGVNLGCVSGRGTDSSITCVQQVLLNQSCFSTQPLSDPSLNIYFWLTQCFICAHTIAYISLSLVLLHTFYLFTDILWWWCIILIHHIFVYKGTLKICET